MYNKLLNCAVQFLLKSGRLRASIGVPDRCRSFTCRGECEPAAETLSERSEPKGPYLARGLYLVFHIPISGSPAITSTIRPTSRNNSVRLPVP